MLRLKQATIDSPMRSPRGQQGIVLVVCLLLLLVLTLIGLTATRSTTLQQRMAANQYGRQMAFQAAEAGLRAGENYLESVSLADFDGANGLYDMDPLKAGAQPPDNVDWSTGGSDTRVIAGPLSNYDGDALPRYYIVHTLRIAPIDSKNMDHTNALPDFDIFKIVARGTGPDGKSPVVLRSFYKH